MRWVESPNFPNAIGKRFKCDWHLESPKRDSQTSNTIQKPQTRFTNFKRHWNLCTASIWVGVAIPYHDPACPSIFMVRPCVFYCTVRFMPKPIDGYVLYRALVAWVTWSTVNHVWRESNVNRIWDTNRLWSADIRPPNFDILSGAHETCRCRCSSISR